MDGKIEKQVADVEQWFSNSTVHTHHLGGHVKIQILIW